MTDFLDRFEAVKKIGTGWTCRCPAHDDQQNSLSMGHADGKWLLKCHAGCSVEEITASIGITLADLFDRKSGRGDVHPSSNRATAQPCLSMWFARTGTSSGFASRISFTK